MRRASKSCRSSMWVVVVATALLCAGDHGLRAQAPPGTSLHHYFGPVPHFANSPLPVETVRVTFVGPGTGAVARAVVDSQGAVSAINVVAGGQGYDASTLVLLADATGGPGNSASAIATVVGGAVTSVTVVSGGTGFTPAGGLRKFVDRLPGFGTSAANNLGQYIPVAVPDTTTYPGSDYYEIAVVQYREKMHTDLPPTTLRGYVQLSTNLVPGAQSLLFNPDGSAITLPDGTQAKAVDVPHFLGPVINATKNKPVRILFRNLLPTGQDGNLFIPVDTTVPGAGRGSFASVEPEPDPRLPACGALPKPADCYTENRATLRLHGGLTPWISDGSPHQWITPAGENTQYPRGVSVHYVPDMPDPGPGAMTFFYSNQQSARFLFYHDGSWGITRLNVYAGEAAPYLIADPTEQSLVSRGLIPADQIPLILQDKTFVPGTAQLAWQDPAWDASRWGGPGSLWVPHVYLPAQNPFDISGVNQFGRWPYGPWFWPPTGRIDYGPIANPYFDSTCNPDLTWCEPLDAPGVPLVSVGMGAYNDTPVVNGTAYPTLTVEPKSYRLRILNASNDRFWNLQLYRAASPAGCAGCARNTEVRMVPAQPPALPLTFPEGWPADGREGGAPDPAMRGPEWIQIGNDGGFLPSPAVIPVQPVTWNLNPTTFNFGNVEDHSLLLGPRERADVVVDFSQFAGQTLILYNDAPAPFPALDQRYDYYTGGADLRDKGGAPSTFPGYGPNTRTIMQITVSATPAASEFDRATLQAAFLHHADGSGVFESSQNPIVVGQANATGVFSPSPNPRIYNDVYGTTFPTTFTTHWGYARIQDTSLSFMTAPLRFMTVPVTTGPFTLPLQPKTLHDEMGAAYDDYGRLSPRLGLETPFSTNLTTNFVLYPYANPPTEVFTGIALPPGIDVTPFTSGEGTQLWKITHNGVDTHAIQFGPFGVQVVNRVGWDGAIRRPDANELGWKDTVRVSPLEDTIVAIRPILPKLPFGVPDSVRPLNPMLPLGRTEGFVNINGAGSAINPPITNQDFNFGWEYLWGSTGLGEQDTDMKRPLSVIVARALPAPPVLIALGVPGSSITLSWTDGTPVTSDPATWGDPRAEIGYRIERAIGSGAFAQLGSALANVTTFPDGTTDAGTAYRYRVVAFNAGGDALSNIVAVGSAVPDAPTGLVASLLAGTGVGLTWTDNSTNETGFRIERAVVTGGIPGAFATVGTVGAGIVAFSDATVAAATTYQYRVFAFNGSGDSLPSNLAPITTPAAQLPPAKPTYLVAVPLMNPPRTLLTFTDNALDETGFVVERSVNGGLFGPLKSLVARVGTGNVTSSDTTALINNTYAYRVKAVKGGLSSGYSNTATADFRVPAAPSDFRVTAVRKLDKATVTLTWTDKSENETWFEIQRASNATFTSGLSTTSVAANSTQRIETRDRGKTYYYRIRAVNLVTGASVWVNAVPFPIVTP